MSDHMSPRPRRIPDRSPSNPRQRRSYSRSRSGSPSSSSRKKGSSHARRSFRSRSRSRGRARSRSRSPMSSRRRHMGSRENPSANKCLGVFGLSLRTNERDLRDVFSRYGPIEECTVVIDAQSGRSRGFAFIYYENVDDAKGAKEACNGIEIDGRRIRVDFSITQRAHTPTPGIYMGKPSYGRSYDSYRSGRRRNPDEYHRSVRCSPPSSHYRRRSRHSRSRSYSPRKYY